MKYILTVLILSFSLLAAEAQHYTIEQFLTTTTNTFGHFNHDESKIFYSGDQDGFFNVYSRELESGKVTKLTNSSGKSNIFVTTFPNDDRFIFTSDEFGDEIDHLYLWEGENLIRDLTPKGKAEFAGWSDDRGSFFYLSNERDPRYMDLYEMDIATFKSKVLYENEGGLEFNAISLDKNLIALSKPLSTVSTQLFIHNIATGKTEKILSHQEDIRYFPTGFGPDQTLYYLTDEDHEFLYLKRYHLDTGASEILERGDWDLLSSSFSPSGRYHFTGMNEDGRSVVKIFDNRENRPLALPSFSEGEITAATVSHDEKWLLLGVSGSRSPLEMYLYDLQVGSSQKLTEALSPEIRLDDLVKGDVIRYTSYDGLEIPAFYYEPKNIQPGQKVPAIILVHGGPGGQSKDSYNYLTQYLVNRGYAVLAVNHRGSDGYGKSFYKGADRKHGEADLDDLIVAKQFLIASGRIDGNKIGIMGGSYGGYMTLAALSFRPDEMAFGIDLFGVSNWVRTLKSMPSWWEAAKEGLYKKIGHPDDDLAYLESISPLFHAEKIVKPLFVLQGANDPRVLKIESDQIVEKVKKAGAICEYVVFHDEGHGVTTKQNKIEAARAIFNFLNTHAPVETGP